MFAGGAGMSDAMVIGGSQGGTRQLTCEEYNGSSWAAGGSLAEASQGGSAVGDTLNARYVNGYTIVPAPYPNSNDNDEYNGTSWSADTVCPTTTNNVNMSHVGTGDLCRFGGGHTNGTGNATRNDEWNGTTWSTAATQALSDNIQTNGTQDDMFAIDGGTGTYEFNGTSWAAWLTVNVNRKYAGGAGGTASANSCGGRTVGEKDTTSICDGVSWSAGATMLNENANTPTAASPDVSLSMMVCGGIDPSDESDLSSVQELVEGVFIARTALGTGRQNCGCAGISLSP